MNIEREKKVLKEIITAVNNEKYGMRRFLQATPYVEHDYFSFNGVINEEVFYEHLYYESKSIENKKLFHFRISGVWKNDFYKCIIKLLYF